MTQSADVSIGRVKGYHVHVYYDGATRASAEELRAAVAREFAVECGALRDGEAGPHPVPQFRIICKSEVFPKLVPWLMLNRQGLDILVHPLSEDSLADHTRHALWLGRPVALKLAALSGGYSAEQYPRAL